MHVQRITCKPFMVNWICGRYQLIILYWHAGCFNGRRMIKNISRIAFSAALAFAGLLPAYGIETLTITDGAGDTATASSSSGLVTIVQSLGNWNLNFSAGLSMPIIGSAVSPAMDLMSINQFNALGAAAGANTLTIIFTETGFGPASGTVSTEISGTQTHGSTSFTTLANGAGLTSSGALTTAPFSSSSSGVLSGFSGTLTEKVVLTALGSESVGFNATLCTTASSGSPVGNTASGGVPDSGMTLVLLGASLTALGLFARLRKPVEM